MRDRAVYVLGIILITLLLAMMGSGLLMMFMDSFGKLHGAKISRK